MKFLPGEKVTDTKACTVSNLKQYCFKIIKSQRALNEKEYNMDFDDWLREKEGNNPYKGLEDAVGKTVSNMYGDIVPCPKCGRPTNTYKDFSGKCCCQHCGNIWFD